MSDYSTIVKMVNCGRCMHVGCIFGHPDNEDIPTAYCKHESNISEISYTWYDRTISYEKLCSDINSKNDCKNFYRETPETIYDKGMA